MPAEIRGFISFRVEQSEIFFTPCICDHRCGADQEKRTENAKAFSVLFLSVGYVFYSILKSVLKSITHLVGHSFHAKVFIPKPLVKKPLPYLQKGVSFKAFLLHGKRCLIERRDRLSRSEKRTSVR